MTIAILAKTQRRNVIEQIISSLKMSTITHEDHIKISDISILFTHPWRVHRSANRGIWAQRESRGNFCEAVYRRWNRAPARGYNLLYTWNAAFATKCHECPADVDPPPPLSIPDALFVVQPAMAWRALRGAGSIKSTFACPRFVIRPVDVGKSMALTRIYRS